MFILYKLEAQISKKNDRTEMTWKFFIHEMNATIHQNRRDKTVTQ